MKNIHLILTIGGGFTGVVVSLQGFITMPANLLVWILLFGATCIYAYGIFAGLKLARDSGEVVHVMVFYWLQVPWISSPLILYRLASGFHVTTGMVGDEVTVLFRIGSEWQFAVFGQEPWGFGLNVFGLIMAIIATKALLSIKRKRDHKDMPKIREDENLENSVENSLHEHSGVERSNTMKSDDGTDRQRPNNSRQPTPPRPHDC